MQATKKVATLALKIKQLKAFVHVSTAYVNCNLPRGSHIEEQIYPLHHKDGSKVEHKKLAIKLAAMPPNKAEAEVCSPLLHWVCCESSISLHSLSKAVANSAHQSLRICSSFRHTDG